MRDHALPSGVRHDRDAAVTVRQSQVGCWAGLEQYLNRMGHRPTPTYSHCCSKAYFVAICLMCGKEVGTQTHVLLRYPCLCGTILLGKHLRVPCSV